jgi:hypothetical protein
MKVNYTYIIAICTIVLFGCKKENKNEDPPTIDFGHFELLNTTIQQFPYNDSIMEFIFTDSLNNEYTASTSTIFNHFGNSGHMTKYKDSEENFFLTYHTQTYGTILTIPSLNKKITVEASVKVNADDYEAIRTADVALIHHSGQNTPMKEHVFIAVDERSRPCEFPDANLSKATLTIHGETFNNIYSNENDGNTIIYFNFEKGIVGFKDITTGISYKLK